MARKKRSGIDFRARYLKAMENPEFKRGILEKKKGALEGSRLIATQQALDIDAAIADVDAEIAELMGTSEATPALEQPVAE